MVKEQPRRGHWSLSPGLSGFAAQGGGAKAFQMFHWRAGLSPGSPADLQRDACSPSVHHAKSKALWRESLPMGRAFPELSDCSCCPHHSMSVATTQLWFSTTSTTHPPPSPLRSTHIPPTTSSGFHSNQAQASWVCKRSNLTVTMQKEGKKIAWKFWSHPGKSALAIEGA